MSSNLKSESQRVRVHPVLVRVTHWINVVAMFIMIGSGWRIYNDSPIFPGTHFPIEFTLGGDFSKSYEKWQDGGAGGALQWHFAGMWLLVVNGLVYFTYGLLSGRFQQRLLPVSPGGVLRNVGDALRLRLSHEAGVYNHVQRLLYIGVLALGILVFASGLAIWKPVQLWWLAALFYDFQGARLVHFIAMAGIVLFIAVHVLLAVLVPSTILSMITGTVRRGHAVKQADQVEAR